ncbi:FTR1 family protein [Paenibacillus doosanensis]|uniref:Ferrous iron permease EfeU n=1 Tax=Paenibacillus konkukensis TaxID=2020716 RepID=A0ABY4RXB3_9BACL|nr:MULTISPECIES: FTR1 family protein [Paenibacillus]MCS7463474.1 FTR1 family protein [Paenibacillus doosanensis]UQZ86991.1 Ferrous iron permease EfeU precursor [Paenibacillus konkukensis]
MISKTQRPRFVAAVGVILLLLALLAPSVRAAAENSELEKLLPIVGGALVEAGDRHWDEASKELEQFEAQWSLLKAPSSALADQVSAAAAEAKKALGNAQQQPDEAYQAVSRLAKAAGSYVSEQEQGAEKEDGKQAARSLLPVLQQCLDAIRQNNWSKAQTAFKQFVKEWGRKENAIRADNTQVYGQIETLSAMARVSVQADPPKADSAADGVTTLIKTIEDYANGTLQEQASAAGGQTIGDALALLRQADGSLSSGHTAEAVQQLQSFIALWPSVEGAVSTRAPDVYTNVENEMTEALSRLLSTPPRTEEAAAIVNSMQTELEPFASQTSYTAWDAGLILLREGMEALLVLAALVAFLHRTGNAAKQGWVWFGALTGLLLSGALALLLNYMIANVAAGSTREMLEGVTGLVSVVLMLTVGAWLHKKSQISAWNKYIEKQVGVALMTGNLWSLFVVACLAILREGAETTIFYIGMAPAIEGGQLAAGIGAALLLLAVIGFVIVKGSIRLPIRVFFLGATALIYYLVIKFLGESVHSLQVAGKLSSHVPGFIPSWGWLGVYPTWETFVPQLVVAAFIIFQVLRYERRKKSDTDRLKSNLV